MIKFLGESEVKVGFRVCGGRAPPPYHLGSAVVDDLT